MINGILAWLADGAHWQGDDGILRRVAEHLQYSLSALLIAALIAIPLGLYIGHTGRGRFFVVSAVGAARAIPSLGLLYLAFFWLGPRLSGEISYLAPTGLVLVVLAIPPILSGAYAGVEGVEPAARDAAKGMGMRGTQVLRHVEIPCALPLIMSGIRSAMLQVIATATIAAVGGLGGLGRFIIDGLAVQDTPQTASGAVLVAALALIVDVVLALVQRSVVPRGLTGRYGKVNTVEAGTGAAKEREKMMTRTKIVLALTASAVTLAAACGSSDPLASGGATGKSDAGTIIVGSANFPESELLAEIYAGALSAKGVKVEKKLKIGSRETYLPALKEGSIDVIPEYTGNLSQYLTKNTKATDPDGVYDELKVALPSTLTLLEKSAAEDKDAVVVTKETATRLSLKSIGDLASSAKDLTLGGPPEWKIRASGVPGLKKVYNLEFKTFRPLDAGGPLSVQALKNGQVDAVNLFTTDPSIAANSFVVLDDPKALFVAQNVVPIITTSKLNPTISAALNAISAKLDTATLSALLKEVVVDKKDADAVAKEFLTKNGLG